MTKDNVTKNDKDFALMVNKLQIPLTVRNILNNAEPLDDEALYTMHTMLSDMQTTDVLVCASLTLKEISSHEGMDFAGYNFLHTECNRIIKKYAHAHIFAPDDQALWNERLANTLSDLLTDMENFTEILELCRLSFDVMGPQKAKIIGIFSAQLQSHTLIMDEIAAMHSAKMQEQYNDTDQAMEDKPYYTDNVIPFRLNA